LFNFRDFELMFLHPYECGPSIPLPPSFASKFVRIYQYSDCNLCRVEYKKLHSLRGLLVGVPFVALTATATERYGCYTASFLAGSSFDDILSQYHFSYFCKGIW
jgi:hypothetical protein